jgi:hypothetical protein
MKLRESHVHHRVRKPEWPQGMFFEIEHFGNFIVIAKDEQGKQTQFNRDDMDKDWIDCGNYQEGHHVH